MSLVRFVGCFTLLGCADPAPPVPPVIGDVTVTVSSNAARGEFVMPGHPIGGAYVFDDHTTTRTDSAGRATLHVTAESNTIHVLTESQLYTVNDVPPGSSIVLGNRPLFDAAGIVDIQFPKLADTTYQVNGTVACFQPETSTAFEYDSACVSKTQHLFLIASDATGVHTMAATFALMPETPVILSGPYVDAIDTPVLTAPLAIDDAAAGLIDAAGNFTSGSISDPSSPGHVLAAPEAHDLSVATDHSDVFERGSTTVDVSRFLSAPIITSAADGRIEWTFAAGPRIATGSVVEMTGSIKWTVYSGPDRTSVEFPTLPPEANVSIDPATAIGTGQITYYAIDDASRTFDIDATFALWTRGISMPEHSLALSDQPF